MLVYNIAHDLNIPSAHPQLVNILRHLLDLALRKFDLAVLKIRAHVGHEGNERADKLAFHGVTHSSDLGRHSDPPRLPLRTSISSPLLPGTVDSQTQFLLTTVLESSSHLKPRTETLYRKEYLSDTTKSFMDQIENTSASDYHRLSRLHKAVKRHVKKDKGQPLCDNLLQDSKGPPSKQWQTFKFIRKPYVPRTQLSRDQNPLVGNPLASGNKDLAVSKRVGFVSYRKQNRSACCAVSRRKLFIWGSPRCHRKRRKRWSRKASAVS